MIKLEDLLSEKDIDEFVESLIIDTDIKLPTLDSKNFPFEINGKKYEIRVDVGVDDNKNKIAEFKFYLTNNPKKPNRSDFTNDMQYQIALKKSQVGVTGSGDYFSVFKTVISIMAKYCEENNIDYITFTAEEKNRQSLYNRMINKIINKYKIPFKQIFINPMTNINTGPEEFWLEKMNKQ